MGSSLWERPIIPIFVDLFLMDYSKGGAAVSSGGFGFRVLLISRSKKIVPCFWFHHLKPCKTTGVIFNWQPSMTLRNLLRLFENSFLLD